MKKSLFGLVAASLFGWAGLAFSYVPPANPLGGAIAESITQNLLRRGFGVGDPRVIATIESVGARLVPLAGGGATWIGVVARLSPWVLAGCLVYEGVKWYFDAKGNVTTQATGATVGAVQFGGVGWSVGGHGPWFASPEEAAGWYQLTTSVFVKVYDFSLYGEDLTGGFRYWVSGKGDRGDTGWTGQGWGPVFVYRGTSTATCKPGEAANGSACYPTGLTPENFSAASATPEAKSMQQAYDELPAEVKTAPMSPELAAEIANRLWRHASGQAGYQGVPFADAVPVVSTDFAPHQAAHPQDWPKTSAMNEPVPVDVQPIKSTNPNPNQVAPAASAVQLDLGIDPGTPPPTLEEPPTEIFKPVEDLLNPWVNWQVPGHDAQCPTWHASPSIAGRVLQIDLVSHCDLAEQDRSLIVAAALACWLALAAFIVLSA